MLAIPISWQILLVGVIAIGLLRWLESNRRKSDVGRFSKPDSAHWLWGHEKVAWATNESEFYVKAVRKLGRVVGLKAALNYPDILVLADPGAIHHVFSRNAYNYIKSPTIQPVLVRITGTSLLTIEGEQHKQQRQKLSPVFTHEQIKRLDEEVRVSTSRMVSKLREHVMSSKSGSFTTVDMPSWTGRATLDIIGRAGFGHDFECGESPEAKQIQKLWSEFNVQGMLPAGFIAPLVIRLFPWINHLPIPALKAQGEMRRIIRKAALDIIRNREATGEKPGKDLVSTLLKMKDEMCDLDEILDQAVLFVIAGLETSSDTLSFALRELARNPDMQERLRDEVNEFQGSGPGFQPTYDEYLTKLPFLDAVMKETLRMYPAQALNERVAAADDVIPLKYPIKTADGELVQSINIRKGQICHVPTLAVNRDPYVWGADSERFDPTRWLDSSRLPAPDKTTSGVFGTFTFIEGPRLCIGYRLALFECKVILSALVQNFAFEEADEEIAMRSVLTLQPYIVGQMEDGVQLPLKVKLLDI